MRGNGFTGSETELIVGEIYGLRTWSTRNVFLYGSDDGHLWPRGVAAPQSEPWKPGDNRATCHVGDNAALLRWGPDELWRHHIADPDCACGFWAYHGIPGISHWSGVLGVVSAWGPVTEGSKGFRAGYARIEALYLPGLVGGERRVRRHVAWGVKWFMRCLVAIALGQAAQTITEAGSWWWSWPVALLVVLIGVMLVWGQITLLEHAIAGADHRWGDIPIALQRKIAEHYPDAVVFGSIAQMRRAYPREET